ncbi:MAG: LysR family transcriptional regulator substrate-binding protein [Coriobacteriales bacterium]|nr:LysR family transcriptional regulator substrate-binding protein [Coriobacteriales bacterium]
MSNTFAVSGQHYLFDVQAFAHTVLQAGGAEYSYALRDRTTRGVINDVAQGASEIGVLLETQGTAGELEAAIEEAGLVFTPLVESSPQIALPKSHPLSNSKTLSIEDLAAWPYLYFEQEEDAAVAFAEEALAQVPRAKTVACTDRASLSELASALNGYTVTSGILVGITDGGSLTTIPLETDVKLILGYVSKKGAELSPLAQKFVSYLDASLKRYAK